LNYLKLTLTSGY